MAGHAQEPCARSPHLGTAPSPDAAPTLAAKLRAFYAEGPSELSTAELAERFSRGDERQIQRAHRLIRQTYRERFVEVRRAFGRTTLTVLRWIAPPREQHSFSRGVVADRVSLPDPSEQLDLRAHADRARVRASRPEPPPRVRHRARRLELPRVPLLEQPIAIEAGVLDALKARHGAGGLWRVLRILREPRCHERPAEAVLAARTLADRDATVPGALFRHLFRRACEGDLLADAPADRERTREAELAYLTGPPEAPPDELRMRRDDLRERLAAVRLGGDHEQAELLTRALAELERWIGHPSPASAPRPRPRPPPASASPPRGSPEAAARFLGNLTFIPGDT
jgi:hypothetical protein